MKKLKVLVWTFFMLELVLVLGIVSSDAGSTNLKHLWKMASVAPEGTLYTVYFRKNYAETFKRVTNGEVSMDWYNGCIMGDEEDYIAKMRIRQLHGCVLSVGGVLMVCPEMSVLQLPFLFNSVDEVAYIRKKMRQRFTKLIQKNGYKLLMWGDQGFDQIYSTKYQMKTIEDFQKSKFVNHAGFVENKIIRALGANPVIMGIPEVASSTRSGVIDTCLCPPLWTLGTQLYTITKYVNTLKFRYGPALMVLTIDQWNKLSQKHQAAINEELSSLENGLLKKAEIQSVRALTAMIQYGIKEVKLTSNEIAEFKNKLIPLWDDFAGSRFSKELLDTILMHLKDRRGLNLLTVN